MDRDAIIKKLAAVGRAALTVDLENSHSGNLSMRCEGPAGERLLAITATGSQKGELTPDKVCFPSLDETNYGYFKASSETDIHARVLELPDAKATMHVHSKIATVVTMDDDPSPKSGDRKPLAPADPLGARYLGEVPVDWFKVACGSSEMSRVIPERLKTYKATVIQDHGGFARGRTLEEAFFYLGALENSAEVILNCEILGIDPGPARRLGRELAGILAERMPEYPDRVSDRLDFGDEPDTVDNFLNTGFRIFESKLSPFHSGSMSLRAASTILYSPHASLPRDLRGPLLEVPSAVGQDGPELEMHRSIYGETPFKSLIHAFVPEADAMAAAYLSGQGRDRIVPIDAEGGFLYPAVPILPADTDMDTLCRSLLDYKIAIVAFGGVWSAGDQALGEALRHVSSVKDICKYRILGKMRGLELSRMEPDRSCDW